MRSFDGVAHFLGEFGEQLPDDVVGGKAIRILCFEIFLANSSALVDKEKTRVRHSFGHTLCFNVLNSEAKGMTKGMAHPGFFFIDESGAIREKYFESKYTNRFTANNVIGKLLPELIEEVSD